MAKIRVNSRREKPVLLQGFPSDFVIPVSDVQAYKQFGNSVAVPVIKALAQEIYMGLFQNEIA